MVSRSWQILIITLLLAAAFPPPRVTNSLIASSNARHAAHVGKSFQSRGRNRIGSAVQYATCPMIANLTGGRSRPARTPRPCSRRVDRGIAPLASPISSALEAPFRLRC